MAAKTTKSADRGSCEFTKGSTAELSFLEIHATTQYKGATKRPPHAQKDIEELIIVKKGKMKFTLGRRRPSHLLRASVPI